MNGWWVKVDVEAVLDTLEYCGLVDIVVTSIDDTNGMRPTFLCCSYGCPKYSFAATSSVTVILVSVKVTKHI